MLFNKKSKLSRKSISIIAGIVFSLLAMRLSAPFIATIIANNKLTAMEGISGSIRSVNIDLYRGAYSVNELTLYLQENVPDSRTVFIQKIDISVSWDALFRGNVVAKVVVNGANLTLLDEKAKENAINEEALDPETWLTLIEFASPISIDQVTINNSKLVVTLKTGDNLDSTSFTNVVGEITNITNSKDFTGDKVARFAVSGLLDGSAKTKIFGSINPDTRLPTFDINLEMKKLSINKIDPLIAFYTPLDIEAGEIDVAIEITSTNGSVEGYAKAGVYNVDVFSWKQDIEKDGDNILTGILEGSADAIASIFSADEKDLIAVNVPITGTLENTRVSVWDALTSLFYNAFVEAYDIKLDDSSGYQESEE